jgi:3-methylfumaryl-CoA hydratase
VTPTELVDSSAGTAVNKRTELIVPEPAVALAGLLDIPRPPMEEGDPLPMLWHWFYLLERCMQSDLGPDGHPTQGIPAPPGPGSVRMFAGGRVTMRSPLLFGRRATRRTWLAKSVEKQGKSGPLLFVTTRTDIAQDGVTVLVEEQDIVYRKHGTTLPGPTAGTPTAATASGSAEPTPASGTLLELDVDPVVLFRFSALTYNAHRIHYDLPYARSEGYPDIMVHGPLQALLMGEVFRRSGVPLQDKEFSYRLVAPTFGSQRVRVIPDSDDPITSTRVQDAGGQITATSSIRETSLPG